jgi:hypothetical protein
MFTSQKTYHIFVTKISRLMYRNATAVSCEYRTEHKTVWAKCLLDVTEDRAGEFQIEVQTKVNVVSLKVRQLQDRVRCRGSPSQ